MPWRHPHSAMGMPISFRVVRGRAADLGTKFDGSLKDYAAIFLLNVWSLPEGQWNRLNRYVREGGGLTVGLGGRVDPASYNSVPARGAVARV